MNRKINQRELLDKLTVTFQYLRFGGDFSLFRALN